MGKKNKKDNKGKGKEKTALKTEKKAEKRSKKELAKIGEDDIEKLIAEFQEKDKKMTLVSEEKCSQPSPRCNMTLSPHPNKDELIMFGGEYCVGNKTYMYNDLLFYNIKKNEWTKVTAPNAPPPRSSHQAVAVAQGGGQLWIFGGEFASPTQSQFYHYKELWVFHLKDKQWEKISVPGPPSSRSGHRMVYCMKHLIVFGGFHDNIRDYRYFNDVFAFNMETYNWTRLEPSGPAPAPRSGCVMAAMQDQAKIVIYGGYSKTRVKRDIDKGQQHTDMFTLIAEGKTVKDEFPAKWKWVHSRQTGLRPSPRCGMSIAVTPGNRAICFGGVFDQEEDEEQIDSVFYNEMYTLDLERGKWFNFSLRDKKSLTEKRKRRRKKDGGDADDLCEEGEDEENDDEEEEMEIDNTEEDMKKLKLDQDTADEEHTSPNHGACIGEQETLNSNSVFKVTVGPQVNRSLPGEDNSDEEMNVDIFMPSPRMGANLTVKSGKLFLYGGTCEVGDKQFTYSDFYCLDLHKSDEWVTLVKQDKKAMEWYESDSSDDEEKGACGGGGGKKKEEDEEEDESDEDIDAILEGFDVPAQQEGEDIAAYFERTKDFWIKPSQKYFEDEDMNVSKRTIMKFAKELCQEYCDK